MSWLIIGAVTAVICTTLGIILIIFALHITYRCSNKRSVTSQSRHIGLGSLPIDEKDGEMEWDHSFLTTVPLTSMPVNNESCVTCSDGGGGGVNDRLLVDRGGPLSRSTLDEETMREERLNLIDDAAAAADDEEEDREDLEELGGAKLRELEWDDSALSM